jgi:DNA-binding response OmpR family regulator
MILLAENHRETREHLTLLLTHARFRVVQAADGREALKCMGLYEELRGRGS